MSEKEKAKVKYNDINYLMIQKKINADFSYVYLLPQSELVKHTLDRMKVFIYLLSILSIVLIGASVFSTVQTTKFVSDFTIAMGRIRDNDYDTRMKRYDNQALDELVDTFNSMTYEIKTLLQKISESKQLLEEMEIKSLQHQMNPHFLFNILLTIQIRAKMSGDETIYRMISSLATLLRAGIYVDKRATITIREELKHVEYYLSLQKERYEDRLSYYIQIEDESLLECEIPRLIIEPIAENAIVHGVENTTEQAVVSVLLNYEKEDIVIHVIDNGIGFDVDEVTNASQNSEEKQKKRKKVGLYSTNQRLKLIYGENYGLRIQSKKNEGTDIKIRVPKKRLGNLNDKSRDWGI
jgi:two-component system sensor histidine kinase YesM